MNLLTHFKQIILSLLVTIGFGCLGLLPQAQAAKVGCLPDFSTAIGCNSMTALNGGIGDSGFGWFALFSNVTGSFNTAFGAGALDLNLADNNTATGASALLLNTTGTNNTANGVDALAFNSIGNNNTANGAFALFNNVADNNTAVGWFALMTNTSGHDNTASGIGALSANTTGPFNTAIGQDALTGNTTGSSNTAIGSNALLGNTDGTGNIALGTGSGSAITTGDNNIYIGNDGVDGDSGAIRIGRDGIETTAFISGVHGTTTGVGDAIPVLIDSTGQLGTMSSSRRFKNEIKPMDSVSEAILALKPVTFHYKSDRSSTSQFGLIAEDVAKVNPDLVVRDKNGEIYTVRYDAVNAMLLNEFLKEHKRAEEQQSKIEEQQAAIARQQKQIEALTAGLQKVSAQIEVSKAVPQTVLNNQ
jgi:hypothetical protein